MFNSISENKKRLWWILGTVIMIIVIILGLALIHRVNDNQEIPAMITVNGTGEIQATPNVSKFSVTIEETAKDQSAALAASSEKVNAVITVLKALGIEEKDIKTEYTSVNPKYDYTSDKVTTMIYPPVPVDPVIAGYTSSHTLSVKVRDMEKVSAVQKAFTDAKVQNVSGPDLSIDDSDALKREARAKAIADAQEQAKILAKQLHVRLGGITGFSENGDNVYPMYMSARADIAMSAKAGNPEATVATGEQTITSNVSITYKIR